MNNAKIKSKTSNRILKIFVRQSLTESSEREEKIVQKVLNILENFSIDNFKLEILTGTDAFNKNTFKAAFEKKTGLKFTPKNFRRERLKLLDTADAIVIIRTGLSESSAVEIAYNIFGGKKAPIFFAIWEEAPIKTTLLRDLDDLVKITYQNFSSPEQLIQPLTQFFKNN